MKPDFQRVTSGNAGQLLTFMRELYAHEGIPWREAPIRSAVDQLLGNEQHGRAWFIRGEGECVGYVILTLAFSVEFGGTFALLDELFIREAWTGKGMGCEAVRFVEEQARAMGAHAVRLEASHDNERAIRFYERGAFRKEERYLMTKRLD